jgi:hypothetical protein
MELWLACLHDPDPAMAAAMSAHRLVVAVGGGAVGKLEMTISRIGSVTGQEV